MKSRCIATINFLIIMMIILVFGNSISVKANNQSIEQLIIKTNPIKTEYFVGDALDITGLEIEGTDSEGNTYNISEGYTLSGFDSSTIGTKEITVTYGELQVSFDVTVVYAFSYELSNETVSITGVCDQNVKSIVIPNKVEGLNVTSITASAFKDRDNITSVTLPDGLEKIGDSAFEGCSGLTEIVVPDTVTSIGKAAFKGTRPESITLPFVGGTKTPQTVEAFGYYNVFGYIFGYETSYNISLDTSSTSNAIYQYAYDRGASYTPSSARYIIYRYYIPNTLKKINITNVTSLFNNAFYNCSNVTQITLCDEITSIGEKAFYDCKSLVTFDIPSKVTSIGAYAFYNCESINRFDLPTSLMSIEKYTFYGCTQITNMVIPENVSNIGLYAFCGAKNLNSINIPQNVTIIPTHTFCNCSSLRKITLPNGLETIGDSAFEGCSGLTEIVVPDTVTSIGEATFKGTRPESITLPFVGGTKTPQTVEAFGYYNVFGYIFGYEKSYKSTLDTSSTSNAIYQYAYDRGASYTPLSARYIIYRYYIPNTLKKINITNVTSLFNNAFYNCSNVTQITLCDEITSIGEKAFYNCSKLKELWFPDSLEIIGVSALKQCPELVIYANKNSEGYKYAVENGVTAYSTKQIELNEKSITLYKNDSKTLATTVLMLNGSIDNSASVLWSSSNESVVKVENGKVTVLGPGNATITATCEGKSDTCDVSVYYLLETISFAENKVNVDLGTPQKLIVDFYPSNTTDDRNVEWVSSNENVAKVSSTGILTAVGLGNAKITATSVLGPSASVDITVLSPITKLELSENNIELLKGQEKTVRLAVLPLNTTDSYEWKSADVNIATVDQSGNIVAVGPGDTVVSVKTSRGKEVFCNVSVKIPSTKLELDKKTLDLFVDDSIELQAILTPSDSTDDIVWSSSDEMVVKVGEDSSLSIISAGTATLTATTTSGLKETCIVTVNNKIDLLDIGLEGDTFSYAIIPIVPNVTVKYGTNELQNNIDYKVEYSNNVNPGRATVKVSGIGRYSGEKNLYFDILENKLKEENVNIDLCDEVYSGTQITKDIKVFYGEEQLVVGEDYQISYENNVDVGAAKVVVSGMGKYSGSLAYEFNIIPTSSNILNNRNVRVYPAQCIIRNDCEVHNCILYVDGKEYEPQVENGNIVFSYESQPEGKKLYIDYESQDGRKYRNSFFVINERVTIDMTSEYTKVYASINGLYTKKTNVLSENQRFVVEINGKRYYSDYGAELKKGYYLEYDKIPVGSEVTVWKEDVHGCYSSKHKIYAQDNEIRGRFYVFSRNKKLTISVYDDSNIEKFVVKIAGKDYNLQVIDGEKLELEYPYQKTDTPFQILAYEKSGNSKLYEYKIESTYYGNAPTELLKDRHFTPIGISDSILVYCDERFCWEINGKQYHTDWGKNSVHSNCEFFTVKWDYCEPGTLVKIWYEKKDGSCKAPGTYKIEPNINSFYAYVDTKNVTGCLSSLSQYYSDLCKASVTVTHKGKVYNASFSEEGAFNVKLLDAHVGDVVCIEAMDEDGYRFTNQLVIKNNPPTFVIDKVTSDSKKIKGTAEPYTSFSIKIGKKTYKAKAKANGEFSVKIPKQKVGTKIIVNATDTGGNTGSETFKVAKPKISIEKWKNIYYSSKSVKVTVTGAKKGDIIKVKIGNKTYKQKIKSSKKKQTVNLKIKSSAAGKKVTITLCDSFGKKVDSCKDIVYIGDTIYVGMSEKNAKLTTWGLPNYINYYSYGPDQWVFRGDGRTLYVYVSGGKVVAIQDIGN